MDPASADQAKRYTWIEKTMKISDLPAGYFRERLLEMAVSPETEVIVVAKHGYVDDWAAYIGWPMHVKNDFLVDPMNQYYLATLRDGLGVVAGGDKLQRDEAIAIFTDTSEWPPDRYRP